MASWEELDQYLAELCSELKGAAYILTDTSKGQLSPPKRYPDEIINRFEAAWQVLQGRFGKNFLRRGRARRVIRCSSKVRFIAEPLLNAYLFVVLLFDPVNKSEIEKILDRARPAVERMIAGLSPLDGGGRRAAQIIRFPAG